jgi:hypothetical protein
MKLRAIEFTETPDGALPGSVTVTMTLNEVVAIAEIFGKLNGYAHAKLALPNDNESIYDVLVGDVINRYWESGTDEFGLVVDLKTINDAV